MCAQLVSGTPPGFQLGGPRSRATHPHWHPTPPVTHPGEPRDLRQLLGVLLWRVISHRPQPLARQGRQVVGRGSLLLAVEAPQVQLPPVQPEGGLPALGQPVPAHAAVGGGPPTGRRPRLLHLAWRGGRLRGQAGARAGPRRRVPLGMRPGHRAARAGAVVREVAGRAAGPALGGGLRL